VKNNSINTVLLNNIPKNSKRILEIGCGCGDFGSKVKKLMPDIYYCGIESNFEKANLAKEKIDKVYCVDIESSLICDGIFDCIIFSDSLGDFSNPLSVLNNLKPSLNQHGVFLFGVSNAQHHSVLASWLSGDFQYHNEGVLSRNHLRLFAYANVMKLLLDAGLIPEIIDTVNDAVPEELFTSLEQPLKQIGQDIKRSRYYMSVYQWVFSGKINSYYKNLAVNKPEPMTFIVPVNNQRQLRDNFLSSPIFEDDHPHQLILLENESSAADAIDKGIKKSVNELIIYAHQDVYFPLGWDSLFIERVAQAKNIFSDAAMFGVYGASYKNGKNIHAGTVLDRHRYLDAKTPLPAKVDSVDELAFGFFKSEFPGTDCSLGYHLYAADIACRYKDKKMSTIVVDALCFHNSAGGFSLPDNFYNSLSHIKNNWKKYFPMATCCITITD